MLTEYTNFSIRNLSIEKFHPDILSQWLSRVVDDTSNYFCLVDRLIIAICSYCIKSNCICINGIYGMKIEECILKTIEYIRSRSVVNIFIVKSEYQKCIEVPRLHNIIQTTNIQLFSKPCYFIMNTIFLADPKQSGLITPINLNRKRGRPPKQHKEMFEADAKPIREKMKARKSEA
jgi:hypothetical protein